MSAITLAYTLVRRVSEREVNNYSLPARIETSSGCFIFSHEGDDAL